jgi:CheY-like chemotaxis protein
VSHSPGNGGRPLKVLHVDDDPMNLRVVQEILGAFGHQAVMACCGQEALERLSTEAFDIVLLDIHMPGMTGIEVIEALRASAGPERNTPVIALTADVYSRRPAEYVALGFNDFVSKPILVSGLMATIKRCTAHLPPVAEPALKVG